MIFKLKKDSKINTNAKKIHASLLHHEALHPVYLVTITSFSLMLIFPLTLLKIYLYLTNIVK